jgi:hypothetical protein
VTRIQPLFEVNSVETAMIAAAAFAGPFPLSGAPAFFAAAADFPVEALDATCTPEYTTWSGGSH